MSVIMTKEQALVRLRKCRDETMEILEVAERRNKLDLYRAAEIDLAMYDQAIECVGRVLNEARGTLPPG